MDNMYEWMTKRRNFIGGKCTHNCSYCYVETLKKRFPKIKERYSGKLFLIEHELCKNEGSGNTVFVQTCGDLFADSVPSEWISRVIEHCKDYPKNTYLFQTKNPKRFHDFLEEFPKKSIFGTTLESNNDYGLSNAPCPIERKCSMATLTGFKKMVSIEPILDFDLDELVGWIKEIKPIFVSIGADSKHNNLPEPTNKKVKLLIGNLKEFTEVKIKDNLKRLT
jgi:DNA repair photolyase